MKKFILIIISLTMFAPFSGSADDALRSSVELITQAKAHDGHSVQFQGEVVGEVMERGSHAWVNVNDGTMAIGIWMTKEAARTIIHSGSHKAKGDTIIIQGVFNRSCPEHGGDLDIHAHNFRIISSGHTTIDPLTKQKLIPGVVLSLVLLVLLIFDLRKKRKQYHSSLTNKK